MRRVLDFCLGVLFCIVTIMAIDLYGKYLLVVLGGVFLTAVLVTWIVIKGEDLE